MSFFLEIGLKNILMDLAGFVKGKKFFPDFSDFSDFLDRGVSASELFNALGAFLAITNYQLPITN